jgi:hypothetical protein
MKPTVAALLTQPSSYLGYGLGFMSLFQTVTAGGLPTSPVGWIGFGGTLLAGIAAILKDDGSSAPAPTVGASAKPN